MKIQETETDWFRFKKRGGEFINRVWKSSWNNWEDERKPARRLYSQDQYLKVGHPTVLLKTPQLPRLGTDAADSTASVSSVRRRSSNCSF